jgi:hypothetical protein
MTEVRLDTDGLAAISIALDNERALTTSAVFVVVVLEHRELFSVPELVTVEVGVFVVIFALLEASGTSRPHEASRCRQE